MRFITEFENTYEAYGDPSFDRVYKAYKGKGALDIGNEICEAFVWKIDEQRFKVHTSLEIEAFPMDKWVEFKKALFSHMDEPAMGEISPVYILQLIKNLESFGKPSGDTITNQQLNK